MSKTPAVRLSTGFEVPLDGDLLAIIEALYKEITLGHVLNSSFETMRAEIVSVINQMSDAERRAYLAESMFLNSVTYENEMLSAYLRRLGVKPFAPQRPRKAAARRKKTTPAKARAVGKKKR
ncbi:MAG: hypothetical protein ABI565_02480 [Vicinamibacteria bacterium]